MAQQNQSTPASKLQPQFYSPSPEAFYGTDDVGEQRQQLKVRGALMNVSLASAFIQAGGTWQDWVDNVSKPSCAAVQETTEVFTKAVNGDQAAIGIIAKGFGLTPEQVSENLTMPTGVVSEGEAQYAQHLTFDRIIPALTSGLGLNEL